MVLAVLFFVCTTCVLLTLTFISVAIVYYRSKYRRQKGDVVKTVAFFHPYCNAGGGGERVLWCALEALINRYPNIEAYVYTTQKQFGPSEILQSVQKNFNIEIQFKNIEFIYLNKQKWIEHNTYPFMTLLGQSFGSMILALEAFLTFQPDILIDTMGCPFAMPIFKLLGSCKVVCYVHYPIITKEMMYRVQKRLSSYNNKEFIAKSPFVTAVKLMYYRFFGFLYYLVGKCSDIIMVNSSWTEEHMNNLWRRPFFTHRIYPPCPTERLKGIKRSPDGIRILSVAQFRPEKNHPLQIQTMFQLRSVLVPYDSVDDDVYDRRWKSIKLVLIGSCRNTQDQNRVQDLKDFVSHLALDDTVEFRINVSYQELLEEYSKATIGVHTMIDEHFGIGVVEMLAAGLVTIAHGSGGPLMDIINTDDGHVNGILATNAEQYCSALANIIENLDNDKVTQISKNARSTVDRFSTEKFQTQFMASLEPLIKSVF